MTTGVELKARMIGSISCFAAVVFCVIASGAASERRNLYMVRDTSTGGSTHFKMKEHLKGKILIDDRPDQMEDRPRFSTRKRRMRPPSSWRKSGG
jgi:hypothetical protein